jgi:signal transduction histidine kinase
VDAQAAELDLQQWLDDQQIRRFMQGYSDNLIVMVLACVLLVWSLSPYADPGGLTAWGIVMAAFGWDRYRRSGRFAKMAEAWSMAKRLEEGHKAQRVKLMDAFAWASLVLTYYGRVPLTIQAIALMVYVGVGSWSLIALAPHWRGTQRYVIFLGLAVIASVLWSNIGQVHADHRMGRDDWMLVGLTILCIGMFYRGSRGAYDAARASLQLGRERELLMQRLALQADSYTELSASRKRLLAGAAHDLRQPVHALNLYADWLRKEPESVAEITPKIVESTDVINRLFDTLFEFARVDNPNAKLRASATPVCSLINELQTQYEPLAMRKGLKLRVKIHKASVWCDPTALRRVLGNLLDNAIKYTESGGVLLASRVHDGEVRLEVWDTGIGIPHHEQDRVFQEFYRSEVHTGTRDGFGLGLAIVRGLAARMGGQISVKSRPGRGSVFRVHLPQSPAPSVND